MSKSWYEVQQMWLSKSWTFCRAPYSTARYPLRRSSALRAISVQLKYMVAVWIAAEREILHKFVFKWFRIIAVQPKYISPSGFRDHQPLSRQAATVQRSTPPRRRAALRGPGVGRVSCARDFRVVSGSFPGRFVLLGPGRRMARVRGPGAWPGSARRQMGWRWQAA